MKKENKLAQQFESWANRLAEGTWAVPESDEDIRKLAELLQNPLPVGVDGENASNALYNLIGDDELFDQFLDLADVDPEADARELITVWLQDNAPDVYQELLSDFGDDPNAPAEPAEQEPELDEGNTYGASGEVYDEAEELDEFAPLIAAAGEAGAVLGAEAGASAGGAIGGELGAAELGTNIGTKLGQSAGRSVGTSLANKAVNAVTGNNSKQQDNDPTVASTIAQNSVSEELDENFGSAAPQDSASPLSYAQQDACDRGPDMERDLEDELAEEWAKVGQSLPAKQIPGKEKLLKTPVTKKEKFIAKAKDLAKGLAGQKDVETFGSLKEQDSLAEMRKLAGLK